MGSRLRASWASLRAETHRHTAIEVAGNLTKDAAATHRDQRPGIASIRLRRPDGWRRLNPVRATSDDVRNGDARYVIQSGFAHFRLPDDMQIGGLKRVVAVESPIAMLLPGSSASIPLVAAMAMAAIFILAAALYFTQRHLGARLVRGRASARTPSRRA